jgi:hypothetical protein
MSRSYISSTPSAFVACNGTALSLAYPHEPYPVGPLTPQHGASSGCGRIRPPDMDGRCEYIE